MNLLKANRLLLFAALIGLSFLSYWGFVDEFFFRDDFSWLANAQIARQDLTHIFTLDIVGYFRPLVHLWILIQYLVFGLNPEAYHVVGILLHALNAILFVYLLKDALGIQKPFLLMAIPTFWVTNVLHYEAVAWLAASSDLLVTTFILLTFLALGRKKYGWFAVAFIAALLTKETAVVLYPLVLLYLLLFEERPWRNWFRSKRMGKPLLITGAAWLLYTGLQLKLQTDSPLVAKGSFSADFEMVVRFVERISMMGLDLQPPLQILFSTLGLVTLFGLYIIATTPLQFRRPLLWSVAFMGLTLLPTLVILTPIPSSRYFYLPLIGMSVVIGIILEEITTRLRGGRFLARSLFLVIVMIHVVTFKEAEFLIQQVSIPGYEFVQQIEPHIDSYRGETLNFVNAPLDEVHLRDLMAVYFEFPEEQILIDAESTDSTVNFEWN